MPVGVEERDGFLGGAIFGGEVRELYRERAGVKFGELSAGGAMIGDEWSFHGFRIWRAEQVCGKMRCGVILEIPAEGEGVPQRLKPLLSSAVVRHG